MGSQETTQTTTIPGIGGQESDSRALLARLGEGGMAQLGNLKDLANGQFTLSPADEEMIRRIQQLTMEQARGQARMNYEDMASQVEGQSLEAGIGGSSIDAVNRAVLGRQLQSTLDQSALQGQINSAQQLRQAAVEGGQMKLNANQLLLQQIMGTTGQLANMGLQERLSQTTTKQKTPSSIGGTLGQLGGMAVAAWNPLAGLGLGGKNGSGANGETT